MKIKKLLLTVLCAVLSVGAWAQPAAGDYYIQNVESGLFLCGGNSWGTCASVTTQGDLFTLSINNGKYTITDKNVSVSNKNLGIPKDGGIYTDTDKSNNFVIAEVSDESGVYTIKEGETNYLAKGEAASVGYFAKWETSVTATAKWRILTKEQAIAQLKTVTWGNSMPASFLLSNPNFSRNHVTSDWTVSANCTNKNLAGGTNENKCAESYHSPFTISQKLEGIPNGVYGVTAQGFVREDDGGTNVAVFFANEATKAFPLKTGSENSMDDASNSFKKGTYTIDEFKVTVTDNTLEVGVKNTAANLWCIWDNFNITYYGVDVTALQETLDGRIAVAEGIKDKMMNATVATALASAITSAKAAPATEDDLTAAIIAINTAIDDANTSVAYYADITSKYDELDAAGKAAFDATTSGTKYANKTLTNEDVTADYILAVKAQGNGSDMTPLITNPSFEDNFTGWTDYSYDNKFGIQSNTAFNKDGVKYCEFYQPGTMKGIKQTLSGLRAGHYQITVHAKARGITYAYLFAGSIKEMVIEDNENDYTVDFYADGTNDVTFGVEGAGTSIATSWIAFDNFRLTYVDDQYPVVAGFDGISAMNAEKKSAMNSAIATYNSAKNDESYAAAVSAIEDAQESVRVYILISKVNTKAATLDAAGQASYASTLTKYNNGELTTLSEAEAAYIAAVKAQNTLPGADFSNLLKGNAKNDWTGATGVYDGGAERYGGDTNPLAAGEMLTQTITDLRADEYYEIQFYAVANHARALTPAAHGEGIAYIFANDTQEDIEVLEQSSCTLSDYLRTLVVKADSEGKIKFGIANHKAGGQWYVAKNKSLTYLGDAAATMSVNEENKYATFCAPFEVEVPDGVTAHTATTVSENTVVLSDALETIQANTPVILQAESGLEAKTFYGKAVSGTPTVGVLTGVYERVPAENGWYILQNNDGVVAFYRVNTATAQPYLPANRCYLTLPAGTSARLDIVLEGETGINNLGTENGSIVDGKYMQNNKVVIVKNGRKYNVTGQIVK